MREGDEDYNALMRALQQVVAAYLSVHPECNAGTAVKALHDLADALTGHHSH